LTQLLISQTKEIGKYEMGIRKRIQDSVTEATNSAIKSIEQTLIEKGTECFEKVVDEMTQHSKCLDMAIKELRFEKHKLGWKVIVVAITSSFFGGLLVSYLLNNHYLGT